MSSSRSTARRSRCAPTIRTCSRRCARSSTSRRPRTAARRRGSAAAARCSSTARPSSAATCRSTRWPASRSSRWRASTHDERDRFADAFAACGGLQCGFCIPGIVMRAKSQIDKKGADLDRTTMAPHLGAHLCRCTGLRQDPRRHRGRRQGQAVRAGARPATVGGVGRQVRGRRADARRPWLHRRHPRARHAARRAALHRPRPRRHRRHRHRGGRGRRRRRRRVHRRRHPRRAAGRHHPQGLAGDDPGRRAHVVRRRRAGDRRRRDPPAGAGRGRAGRRSATTCSHRSPTRSRRIAAGAPRGRVGHRRQRAVAQRLRPRRRRRRRSPPAPTRCTRCSRPSASSTPSSSRSRRWPCRRRVDGERHAARVLRRPGRVGRPRRHLPRARRRPPTG